MSILHRDAPRRSAAAALTGLCLLVPFLLGLTSSPTAAAGSPAYDRSINAATCELLGRDHVPGAGCSRVRCVPGAKRFRITHGAEACQLRGQGSYGFVATIDYRRCAELGRRWIRQVNYCASYPDRSATAVYDAPQCVGARSVYVLNTEADGYYDECLTPERVEQLAEYAQESDSTLTAQASLRSPVQCQDRPATSYVGGKCVSDPGSVPSRGGALMVGDSLTWRGSDELGRLRKTFTLDGEPGRPMSELQTQLDFYAAVHGQPTDLIIALGTVPPPGGFGKSDLVRAVKTVPRTTRIMFVMPYAATPSGRPTKRTATVGGWMKSIAKSRGRTCAADWPSYVRSQRGLLQDGVHVKNAQERKWAKFIDKQWGRC